MDDDPIGAALQSRRLPHGRTHAKSGRGKTHRGRPGHAFDPQRAIGRYTVQVGGGHKKDQNPTRPSNATSWLEIHALTPQEDGFVGTFDFSGKVHGILVLAGSRKGLASIIEDLEAGSESEGDGEVVEEDRDDRSGNEEEDDDDDESHDDRVKQSAIEADDEKVNRRAQVFEKNTFRNPKFWMQWRGRIQHASTEESGGEQTSEFFDSDSGYVVFSGNDCGKFEGTVSSSCLGWDNVKLEGWKMHSKSSKCPVAWKDFV